MKKESSCPFLFFVPVLTTITGFPLTCVFFVVVVRVGGAGGDIKVSHVLVDFSSI